MTIEARFRIDRGGFVLDADLSVPARGVTALYGPTGCGKTTLLRAMAGLERSPGGFLRVADAIWQDGDRFVSPHRRPLGYVFQEASLFTHLTVRRNLEYGLRRTPAAERRLPFDEATDLLGVRPLLSRYPTGLSGGERQRVAIARALLTSPRLLLMDEPLAGVDVASRAEILPFLERLHDELEIPVIYVSHTPDEVARLADHLILMEAGQVLGTGPITEMLTRADLPLAHGADAEAIVEVRVTAHDEAYHLTYLDFPGGRFTVARRDLPTGHAVRLRIRARDVSLTLESQSGTSILNIFPARVEQVADEDPSRVTVRLDVGGSPVLSRITRKSAAALGLEPGKTVYAQVKTLALLT
ncbi:MAG: molybdenum ABC transporter ATP-binding protein [Planctomycetota bacterium]|jgi:molybdate transport system ATP-binding protein